MSFLDQKPFIATEKHQRAPWAGGKNGKYFRCYLCGHRFQIGDIVRWQYTNDTPGAYGNPLICKQCDGPKDKIIETWRKMHEEAKNRMWWFCTEKH